MKPKHKYRTTGPQQPRVLPAMEHVPAEHLHQLCRGLGDQDLGQGLQVRLYYGGESGLLDGMKIMHLQESSLHF